MTPTLETMRLLLRPLELADAEQIQGIFPHWEVVHLLAARVPWPYPPDGAHHYIRNIALPAVERGDEWHWMLRLKMKPDQLIGCISLMKGQNDNRGFWLGLPWQRQGLMNEACEIVTDFWFETLGFPVLRAPQRGWKHRIAAHLGEERDAPRGDRRARLRLGPLSGGDLGDYCGRMAGSPPGVRILSRGYCAIDRGALHEKQHEAIRYRYRVSTCLLRCNGGDPGRLEIAEQPQNQSPRLRFDRVIE